MELGRMILSLPMSTNIMKYGTRKDDYEPTYEY